MTGRDEKAESGILEKIQKQLLKLGIDIETACDIEDEGKGLKCVVVAPNLRKSVKEMGDSQRDQVVMVRVDTGTSKALNAWVATGAVKSRSEAAALFIREGLKMRASELDKLRDALEDVECAKEKLKRKAGEIFGDDSGEFVAGGAAVGGAGKAAGRTAGKTAGETAGKPAGATATGPTEERGPPPA
jgi:hypothetical protein